MIFTDSLVLSEIDSENIQDKNKWFLKYKPPKMENIQFEMQKFE